MTRKKANAQAARTVDYVAAESGKKFKARERKGAISKMSKLLLIADKLEARLTADGMPNDE